MSESMLLKNMIKTLYFAINFEVQRLHGGHVIVSHLHYASLIRQGTLKLMNWTGGLLVLTGLTAYDLFSQPK